MEKKLLLLGLLLSHGMHGYQLNETLQQDPGIPISLKKSNAYKLLNNMEKDGWVSHIEEQEGNRPPRRVYSVTETGKESFLQMLQENLSTYKSPEFPSIVGFDFMFMLSPWEIAPLLEKRLEIIITKFKQLDEIPEETRQSHLAVDYQHQHYLKEIDWLNAVIDRLKSN